MYIPRTCPNPYVDGSVVIQIGKPLPFEDNQFDMVLSAYIFEHVTEHELVTKELLRVTKPRGWIVAVTPNKFGYSAITAMLMKLKLHVPVLNYI